MCERAASSLREVDKVREDHGGSESENRKIQRL
jgi:hypothetical protein